MTTKNEEEPLKSINTLLTILTMVPKTQMYQYGKLFY